MEGAAFRAATVRERLRCRPGSRSSEDAMQMPDYIRPGKWEAGASHAELDLRLTKRGFIIIGGPQGHEGCG